MVKLIFLLMCIFGHNASILPGVVCPLMIKATLSEPFPAKIIEDTSTVLIAVCFFQPLNEKLEVLSVVTVCGPECVYALAVMKMLHVLAERHLLKI